MATITKESLLSENMLSKTFKAIDDDAGGTISVEEFREIIM